jgi:hypothetical protein
MSKVIIHNIDGKLKTEGSLPQTNASLYDQLKEVRHVAIAIGCYDVSDLLMKKIEEIEANSFPMCWKCSNRIAQSDMDKKYFEVIGCKEIKQKRWDKDGNEACPLKKETE